MSLMARLIQRRKMNELITAWVEFRDVVTGLAGRDAATPEQEKRFLDLKASISSRLPILTTGAPPGPPGQEAQNQLRGMTELLNRHLTLGSGAPAPGDEGDDFLSRWHMHFLYLNQFKGQPREVRPARRVTVPPSLPPAYSGHGFWRFVGGIFNNWFTRFVLRVAILAAVVIIGARLLHVDLNRAPEWGRRVAGEWWGSGTPDAAATRPGAAQPAGGAGGTTAAASKATGPGAKPATPAQDRTIRIGDNTPRPKYSVDGTGDFVPPTAPETARRGVHKLGSLVPRPVREFFRPVVERWGVEITVAMVGLGFLLIAYLIFGRAR